MLVGLMCDFHKQKEKKKIKIKKNTHKGYINAPIKKKKKKKKKLWWAMKSDYIITM